MDKYEIVQILQEIATLLELKGDNPFKIRAFSNAARSIETLTEDIATLVKEKKLNSIKGIGDRIAEIITELVQNGKSIEYEKLKSSFPPGIFEILKIPSLGPKKVKLLYEKLKITNVRDLEYAVKENRLLKLKGFGEKSQNKILEGIKHFLKFQGQYLYPQAEYEALEIQKVLLKNKNVIRIEIAGSIRRKKEVIKDIDILVSSKNPQAVMEAFTKLKNVKDVQSRGETKSTVILSSGVQADLRCVTDQEFPYALLYFTGGKEHNTAMRSLAKQKNLKLNEYGLFKGSKNISCKTEENIFKALGLQFIPPELRENTGEMEAAQKGKLPHLVEVEDIKGVFHVHTHASDGNASLEEMVRTSEDLGFEYVGISDHSQSAFYANGLKPEQIIQQHKAIDKLNAKLKKIRILKGIECDILADGSLDYPDKILASFDFVIASIHSRFNMPEKEMTQRISQALKNKYTTMIGHPTGRLILGRSGYKVDIREIINVTAGEGKIMELNANPHRFDVDWRWGQYIKEKKILVSINPDAHSQAGLHDVSYGVGVARKAWFEKSDIVNTRGLKEILKILCHAERL